MAFSPPLTPPPSLPPSALIPSLPVELWSAMSVWPQPRYAPPLTPPTSNSLQSKKPVLPSIAHLDHPPLYQSATLPRLMAPPSPQSCIPSPANPFGNISQQFLRHAPIPPDAPQLVDWLDFTHTRSSQFIAEKTCEMICYLWFAAPNPYPSPGPSSSPPHLHPNNPVTSALQFSVTRPFVQFVQKLLETTQVSQSVIVLSLNYIYRLRQRNHCTTAQPGSEFRISVAGLMMANKFLDDNTYTNKTWSEVSGIDLSEINRMEKEFLAGVDWRLFVSKSKYESWLQLLRGLVQAKDRHSRSLKTRRGPRTGRAAVPRHHLQTSPSRRPYRARSTSPEHSYMYASGPTHLSVPPPPVFQISHNVSPVATRPGDKRSADVAFSPTSANFTTLPSKRPLRPTVQIPNSSRSSGHSYSPLEGLQSFSQLSLASPCRPHTGPTSTSWHFSQPSMHQTLTTAHSMGQQQLPTPQNLYYYALSCSPNVQEEESHWRKSRLRCHKPAPAPLPRLQVPPLPMNIQSACTSPTHTHAVRSAFTVPSISDAVWYRSTESRRHSSYDPMPGQVSNASPSSIKFAPFANAGPPGVHFYAPSQRTPPYHDTHWVRRDGA
jgi:hypothetical protein